MVKYEEIIKKIKNKTKDIPSQHNYEIYYREKGKKRWFRSGKTYEKRKNACKDIKK